jgi:transposase
MAHRRGNSVPGPQKYTFKDFQSEFPSDDACLEYIMERRYPSGIAPCRKCKVDRKHFRIAGRMGYSCPFCGSHVYPLAGTIFHKSTTPLRTWFFVVRIMASTRCGVSAKQIQRETGVTYKTAWRMMNQIRKLMGEEVKLGGGTLASKPVEIDEMYLGGTRKLNAKGGRPFPGDTVKTPVLGMVERDGKIYAKVIYNIDSKTLNTEIHDHVLPDSTVYTDEYNGYNTISSNRRYTHHRIRHNAGQYVVEGHIHTNTIEGFWGHVKNSIRGAYKRVGQKYAQDYLNEFTFRYNRRQVMAPMFSLLLERGPKIQVVDCVSPFQVKADTPC